MGLAGYKTARETIPLPDGSNFQVRGLDVEDLGVLISNHLEPISHAAALYAKHKESAFSTANLSGLIGILATQFPGLVREVIALAADEPEAKNVRLGLAVETAALGAIVKLTVEDAGGLGNLFGQLAALLKGALQHASELPKNIQSRDSIGASEKTSAS